MMAAFALTSAAGQMFIYYTVRHYGSLVCTMITTTRKFFTILVRCRASAGSATERAPPARQLSVFWFGHKLSVVQWVAVAVVFLGIAIDDSFAAKSKTKHAANDATAGDGKKAD